MSGCWVLLGAQHPVLLDHQQDINAKDHPLGLPALCDGDLPREVEVAPRVRRKVDRLDIRQRSSLRQNLAVEFPKLLGRELDGWVSWTAGCPALLAFSICSVMVLPIPSGGYRSRSSWYGSVFGRHSLLVRSLPTPRSDNSAPRPAIAQSSSFQPSARSCAASARRWGKPASARKWSQ